MQVSSVSEDAVVHSKNMTVLATTTTTTTTHRIAVTVFVALSLATPNCCIAPSNLSAASIVRGAALVYPTLTINNRTESEGDMHWSRHSRDTAVSGDSAVYPISSRHEQPAAASSSYKNYGDLLTTYSNGRTTVSSYPFVTADQSSRRVMSEPIRHPHQPRLTRLSVRPVRRLPSPGDEFTSEEVFESSFEQDFLPIAPLYASDPSRLAISPPQQHSSSYPVTFVKAAAAPLFSSSATNDGYAGHTWPKWGAQWQEASSQHVVPIPITITEVKKEPKWDLKKLGILALIKIGLAKLKTFGVLKVLFFILLKFKLALALLFVKFVLFLKALKLIKALLLPFFLLSLLPLLLLLLPLLLLPLLLPLLLLLPVPVPSAIRDQHARIHMLDLVKMQKSDIVMQVMSQLLDSEKCVDRIACQLATKKESKLLFPIIKWYLNKLGSTIRNERISSYVQAYLRTVKEYNGPFGEEDERDWCLKKFRCDRNDDLSDTTAAAAAVAAAIVADKESLETETTTVR